MNNDYMTVAEMIGAIIFFICLLANLYLWAWIGGGYV